MEPWRLCPSTSEGEKSSPARRRQLPALGASLPRCPALFIAISCDSVVKGSSAVHRYLSARRVRSGSNSFSPHPIKTQYTDFEPTQSKASQAHAVHTDYSNPITECQCNPGTIAKSSSLFLTHFLVCGRLIDKFA